MLVASHISIFSILIVWTFIGAIWFI